MRRLVWMATLTAVLSAEGPALRAQAPCCKPPEDSFCKRLAPVGGWCPYGTGPLSWWDPHWFPHCGGRDDYCRKPFPPFCWQPYSYYYGWARPENCCPGGKEP